MPECRYSSTRRLPPRLCRWLVVLAALLGLCPTAWGQTSPAERKEEGKLLVRRVYVPAQDPSLWPTQGETYLPIDSTQLEQLLAEARDKEQPTARVMSTFLYAQLRSDGALEGSGLVRIDAPADRLLWLTLPPSQGHVFDAQWLEEAERLRLGYRGGTAGTGFEVSGPGRIEFGWELHPSGPSGEYKLNWHRSPVTMLLVDVPEEMRCEASPGSNVLVMEASQAQAPSGEEWPTDRWPPPLTGMKRWMITSPPTEQLSWQIRRTSSAADPPRARADYHEQIRYEVGENGTQLVHHVFFKGSDLATTPLVWKVPNELVITAARWGGEALVWTRQENSQLVVLELADGAATTPAAGAAIEIEAWCPTQLGSPWSLPAIEVEGGYWMHGRVVLEVAPELQIEDLTPHNLSHSTGTAVGEPARLEFQKQRALGKLELQVGRRSEQPTLQVGRKIILDGVTATAEMRLVFEKNPRQRLYHIQALVDEGWDIELPEARAPFDVTDWYAPAVNTPGPRRLTVRVATSSPVAWEQERLVLQIKARRVSSGDNLWRPLADHRVLVVEGAEVTDNFVTFESTDPYRLEFLATPPAITGAKLTSVLGLLLPEVVSGQVFDLDQVGDEGAIHLAQPSASFDAHVLVRLEDDNPTWRRSCEIRVVPQQGLVDALEVRFVRPPTAPLRWRIEGEGEWRELELSPEELHQTDHHTLRLPQPTAMPLVVELDLGPVMSDRWQVEPLSVENARQQTMRCEIRSPRPRHLKVKGQGFDLVALPSPTEGGELPLHSQWELETPSPASTVEPQHDKSPRLLVVRNAAAIAPARARIVRAELHSTYAPDMPSRHEYRLEVENGGETKFGCELPPLAESLRYWRDDTPQTLVHPKTTQFELELPGGARRVVYHIEFALPPQTLGTRARLTAPWPEFDLPVVASEWLCELPYGVQVEFPTPEVQPSWRGRLLGVLSTVNLSWLDWQHPSRWHTLQIAAPGQRPTSVEVVSLPQRTIVCLWLLAGSLLVAHLTLPRWPAMVLMAAGVATTLSLLLPPGWYHLAAAVSVGLWFGSVVTALSLVVARHVPAVKSAPAMSPNVTTALLLIAAACLAAPTVAAPPTSPPAGRQLETILIPVDREGHAVGEQQYITPRLLRQLTTRREPSQTENPWIISGGYYEATLQPGNTAERLMAGPWTLSFEVETFAENVMVEFPLLESQASWSSTASVDGVSLPLAWNAEGRGCRLRIAEPGVYLVRIEATPHLVDQPEHTAIELQLPPLADSELRLALPPSSTGVEVNRRPLAEPVEMQESQRLRLPNESRLEIRWPKPQSGPLLSDLQASEMTWMEITPQVIELESVFRLQTSTLLPTSIVLQASEPARRVEEDESGRLVVGELTNRWILDVDPLQGLTDEAQLRIRLRLERSEVMGRIRFPRFDLEATTMVQRRFAGSSDGSLVLSLDIDTPGSVAVDPVEFTYDWDDRFPPEIAVQQMDSSAWPVLAVRPEREELAPEETLDIGCFDDGFRIEYEGVYRSVLQPRWQQSLRVTPDLVVDEVRLRTGSQGPDGATQFTLVRATRPQGDKLVVFFDAPISGTYTLEVKGHTSPGEPSQLPTITTYTNPPSIQRMQLFSGRQVAVRFSSTDVRPLDELPPAPPGTWDAYPVGTYQLATERGAPLAVTLERNIPKLHAQTLTTMLPTATGWIAEVGGVVDVVSGRLWEVKIELPADIAGKIEVEAPVTLTLDPVTTGDRRMARLRWNRVAGPGDLLTFTLRTPLLRKGQRPTLLPDVRVRDVVRLERLVAIPPVDESLGHWEFLGPAVDNPPQRLELFVRAHPGLELHSLSRVGPVPHYVSRESTLQTAPTSPLVETQIWFAPGGGAVARSLVAIPAVEGREVGIALARGQQLAGLSLDGRAVVVSRAEGAGSYRVTLPAGDRPHVLEVVARLEGEVPRAGKLRVAAPQLSLDGQPLGVEQRLWTYDDATGGATVSTPGGEGVSELDQAAVRLNQLLAASAPVASSTPSGGESFDGAWFEYWSSVLESARQQLQLALSRDESNPDVVAGDPAESEFAELVLRAESRVAELKASAPPRIIDQPAADPWLPDEWLRGSERGDWRALAASAVADDAVELAIASPVIISREQWAAALVVLVLAGVLALTTRHAPGLWQSDQVPFALVMLAGMAWWLWLPLPWLGLAITLLAGGGWLLLLRRRHQG